IMVEYLVSVTTSTAPQAGSFSSVGVTLIGTEGISPEVILGCGDSPLTPGSTCACTLKTEIPLGTVVLIQLRKQGVPNFPDLDWHCQEVCVETPSGEKCCFPCNKWILSTNGAIELCSGLVSTLSSETLPILKDHRARELQAKQKIYRWRTLHEGVPRCIDMTSLEALGPNLRYTRQGPSTNLHYLRGFAERAESWGSFQELERLFNLNHKDNTIAQYVKSHWQEDSFFGYQFINGCNPFMIRQCRHLPPNLAVTNEMLRAFLPEGSSLEQEMERGTVFLADYEVLEGVPVNRLNGRQQYLATPLCLLHCDQQGELKPIAIQLQQHPGPQNPVFLPSDSAPDWLLAKAWVRSADFQCHQLISHFLRTHVVGEVCCIATLRQLPETHPLYQVLMPHVSTTLQINIQARASLLAPGGVFDKSVACGLEGVSALLRRATERLCYSALCLPEDLQERGIDKLPHNYFALDGLRVWGAIKRFVQGLVELYYPSDAAVQQDSELQNWIQEIFVEGFLDRAESGLPQSFQEREELTQFLTMVIFSCSALHAAVNFSQLDFDLWMPNCPASMCRPPPSVKGAVTMDEFLSWLPNVNATCSVLITLSLLSQPARDYIPLGEYPKERLFRDGAPRRLMDALRKELQELRQQIEDRNASLELPYPYLSPDRIENSVAI
ncbi:LX15B lipoxygenase, partial [Atractosteus spatula]|nr:LX15B lipoxygenase [Atractosteus spatula]